jgi:hypothetical protein
LTQAGQQTVGTLPGDDLVIGGESFGMARQLFDTEQLGPQWRLAHDWVRTRVSGHPGLKAQWQNLHFVSYFWSRFLQLTCPHELIRLGTSQPDRWQTGAGANQAQRNNVAALAMISSVRMHLNPGR